MTNQSIKGLRFGAAAAVLAYGVSACGGLLDVENPNNIVEEALSNLTAASAVVNGAEATVARGHGQIMQLVSTTADELFFTGSRDAWLSMDRGNHIDPANEFTDAAFPEIAEGRWMADLAVKTLEGFVADNPGDAALAEELGRANIIAAISYMMIGSMFEDYVFSDKKESGMPIGAANMASVLQSAVGYADAAVANSTGDQLTTALAVRARAKWELAAWGKYNNPTPTSPLVSDAGADADATAVLDAVGATDWRYQFTYAPAEVPNRASSNVNSRSEMQWGERFAINGLSDTDPDTGIIDVVGIALMDPIDAVPSAYAQKFIIDEFGTETNYAAMTVVSARRMIVQLAESALESGDGPGFVTQINLLRALDTGLTPYAGGGDDLGLLKYSRMANLIMEGNRLGDLYRFGEQSDRWFDTSPAWTQPGTFFPITTVERLANENIG